MQSLRMPPLRGHGSRRDPDGRQAGTGSTIRRLGGAAGTSAVVSLVQRVVG